MSTDCIHFLNIWPQFPRRLIRKNSLIGTVRTSDPHICRKSLSHATLHYVPTAHYLPWQAYLSTTFLPTTLFGTSHVLAEKYFKTDVASAVDKLKVSESCTKLKVPRLKFMAGLVITLFYLKNLPNLKLFTSSHCHNWALVLSLRPNQPTSTSQPHFQYDIAHFLDF
ncbi:UNVERIFIED_CONTAM: hypothetical protein Sindi_0647900 [Sesamum indicum]